MDALAAAFVWLIRSLHNFGTLRYLEVGVKGDVAVAEVYCGGDGEHGRSDEARVEEVFRNPEDLKGVIRSIRARRA